MKRPLDLLANQTFDLLVIGGGILGAGIARDAVLRGLRVALVEKDDFASGTSSQSTKLIHGGFRYLEQFEFGLVAEACRERTILQRVAPHLVKPQSFLLPVYRGDPRPLWQVRCGMWLYDRFAGQDATRQHCSLNPTQTLAIEPKINSQNLLGSVLFFDCQTDDSRFCIEVVLDAIRRGAAAANYCEAVGAERCRNALQRVWVRDAITGRQFSIRAKVFVNAAGPWVQQVVGLTDWDTRPVALSPTKGIHLLIPPLAHRHGIFFRSQQDRRMLFLVPWGGWSLLGTTDTDFPGDPHAARAERDDVDYLLAKYQEVLPDSPLAEDQIVGSFAGVRPLLRDPDDSPSNRSREYKLVRHGDNLLTVAGGKYTTFRSIADRAVRKVYSLLGRRAPACTTASTPLPAPTSSASGAQLASTPPVFESDIARLCAEEMVVTLTDVMRRRTPLALGPDSGPEVAERISRCMASALGWDEPQRLSHYHNYLAEWERNRAWRKKSTV